VSRGKPIPKNPEGQKLMASPAPTDCVDPPPLNVCIRRNTIMTIIIRPKGTPLPEGHPFSGTRIIFGMKRPVPVKKSSTPEEKPDIQPDQPPARPAEDK